MRERERKRGRERGGGGEREEGEREEEEEEERDLLTYVPSRFCLKTSLNFRVLLKYVVLLNL